ncbi:MAG: hypothetical protein SPI86_05165 [Treponemataceae bacterium]|nr:hypothetical protein [Spirochaetales bacterium]MDY6031135.1 hypothetical protein [Treponemataceae bacterium]
MIRLNIELLKGVNDICFGEFKNVVREKIGLNYKEPENHLDEPEVKKMLQGFKLMMVDISKHALSNFDEMEEIYSLISDGDQNDDIYDGFTIYYNKEEKFEAIEIFPNENIELFVDGVDFSDFTVKHFKQLADDFTTNKIYGYLSHSKEICFNSSLENKSQISSIVFGYKNYYKGIE